MAKIVKNNGADRMPIAAVLFLKTIINRLSVPTCNLCVCLPTPTHKKVPPDPPQPSPQSKID
jgi:hypothetical protein